MESIEDVRFDPEYLDNFLSKISELTENPSVKRWINEVLRVSVKDMSAEQKTLIFEADFIREDYLKMAASYYMHLKEEWQDAMQTIEEKGCFNDSGGLINLAQALDMGKINRVETEIKRVELIRKEEVELTVFRKLKAEAVLKEDWSPEFTMESDGNDSDRLNKVVCSKTRQTGDGSYERLSIEKHLNEYRIIFDCMDKDDNSIILPDVLWQGTIKECVGFALLSSKHLSEEKEFYNQIKDLSNHRVKAGQNYGLNGEVWFELNCEGNLLVAEILLEKDGLVTSIGKSGVEMSPIQARFILAQPTVSGGSDFKPQFTGKGIGVEVYDLLEKYSGLPRVPHGRNGVGGMLTDKSIRFWEKRAMDRKVVGMDCKGTEVRKRVLEEKLKQSRLEEEYRNEYCYGINSDALNLCKAINQSLGWPIYAQVKQSDENRLSNRFEKIWCKTPSGDFFDAMGKHGEDKIISKLGDASFQEISREELNDICTIYEYNGDEIIADARYLLEKHGIEPEIYSLERTQAYKI